MIEAVGFHAAELAAAVTTRILDGPLPAAQGAVRKAGEVINTGVAPIKELVFDGLSNVINRRKNNA